MPQRSAQRNTKIIALELRLLDPIEVVPRIERGVPQKLVHRPMHRIRTRSRHDTDLRPLPLAIRSPIRVRHHVELTHRLHPQQLPARATRRHVDQRGPRILHPVQQVQVVLRPATAYREHTADRRVRRAHRTRSLRRIVHRRRVQCDQLVVAAAIQWQVFHLPLRHQPGGLFIRQVHRRPAICHGHLLRLARDVQPHIHLLRLPHHELHPGTPLRRKTRSLHDDVVQPHGDRWRGIPPRNASVCRRRSVPVSSL